MKRYQDMTSHLRQILENDYFNWESQLSKAKSDELSAFEIARVIKSFEFLRMELGENFPQECLKNDNAINDYFLNRAPWTRMWFTWLADAILGLRSAVNIENLMKKLRSHNQADFFEVRSIFEVGLKLVKAGFNIEIENEVINDKGLRKKPDLTIVNPETEECGLVEITRLTKNPSSIKYESIMQRVFFGGLERNINLEFAGGLLKDLSDEYLQEILKEIDAKLKKML